MILRSIEFSQSQNEPKEWRLERLDLGDINLLVGKNSSGKSKCLNVINSLAKIVSSSHAVLGNAHFRAIFDHDGKEIIYELDLANGKTERESFTSNGKMLLERKATGAGTVFAEKVGKDIEFQTPTSDRAVVARRDSIQHPFFEPLYDWGKSIRHFQFGTPLGKTSYAVFSKTSSVDVDPNDTNAVVGIYKKGEKNFGEPFKNAIKRDMAALGYPIDDIGVSAPESIRVEGPLAEIVGLYVKETGLAANTEQSDMSQGMFRAFSVLIQLNYSDLASKPSCILIDDIGEGLDYDRSCSLIELLMSKASASHIQLIMSTNDRFIMNRVPLETWSVIDRTGGKVSVFNYKNSKGKFDEFKFTGLNNFDFLATNFLKHSN